MDKEKIEVRDTRNGEWAWVYNAVISDPHLSASDVRAYGALSSFGGYQVINPSMDQIAEKGQMSIRQVKMSIKKLEDLEYIRIEKGRGRGNPNVYWLLKRPKGCKFCTISKGCKKEQEKVQKTTVKGAEIAPTIKIDSKDISKDIAPASGAPWDFKEYLKEMEENKQRHINIIAYYFEEKGLKFENKEQVQSAIKRHLRAAKDLVPFTDQQITTAAEQAKKEYNGLWTLETILKILSR